MANTTITISHLEKHDFVASKDSRLSLTSQIKAKLLDPQLYHSGTSTSQKIISHWSDLPFLNRVVAIFENERDAALAYDFLLRSYRKVEGSDWILPVTAKVSLQENLLLRSESIDGLCADYATKMLLPKGDGPSASGDWPVYQEPEPKSVDMYADLLKSGKDISDFTSKEQVEEVTHSRPGSFGDSDSHSAKSKFPTITLFRPSLLIDMEDAARNGELSRLSLSITLDQS